MSQLYVSLALPVLLFLIYPQKPYPPINRDMEYFEKSLKRDEAKLREQQKQLLLAAREDSETIIETSMAIKIWTNSYTDGKLEKKKFRQLVKSLTNKISDSSWWP